MKSALGFVRRLYALCLYLFPKKYREEYREELQTVYDLSIEDAATKGGFELARVVLRELASLPMAIFLEHLRQSRISKMTGNFASRFDFVPGTRREIFAALAPFLLFGALPTLLGYLRVSEFVPLWLDILFVLVLWSFGLGLIVIGFIKRFPRWFMPYIGVPLPFFSVLLFSSGLFDKLWGVWWFRLPGFLSEFLQQGLLWLGQFFLIILLLVATRLLPKSRPFHQRLLKDWTLFAFIVYGTAPLGLVITLNEYKNEELFMFAALLFLAAGAWLYLRNHEPVKQFLALYAGLALSMLCAAMGKAVLVGSSFPSTLDSAWRGEFMSTLVTWLWLAMFMLIAPALNLLPKIETNVQSVPER